MRIVISAYPPLPAPRIAVMPTTSRRSFLKAAGLGTLATLAPATLLRARGSNEAIRIAVAGLNGRGGDHVKAWMPMKDVRIMHLVDPDKRVFAKRVKQLGDKATDVTT